MKKKTKKENNPLGLVFTVNGWFILFSLVSKVVLRIYSTFCSFFSFYLGNTISNWVFLIPPFFGAVLTWEYKIERRYTLAFVSLLGNLWGIKQKIILMNSILFSKSRFKMRILLFLFLMWKYDHNCIYSINSPDIWNVILKTSLVTLKMWPWTEGKT